MGVKEYLGRVISSKDESSAKRLVTLLMAGHFIVTSFLVSFFVFYLIIYTPRGSVNKDLLGLLDKVLEQDFWVITAGLGFITAENFGNIMLERVKAKAQAITDVAKEATASNVKVDDKELKAKVELQKNDEKKDNVLDNDV